jgi:hypothetical protein
MTNAGGQSDYPLAVRPAQQTDLPPGYPQEYRRLVTLHDRRSVLIRPVLPSDAPGLAESIESADADTIYRRFLGGRPQVTPGLLEFLTTVDYASRFALVAVDTASRRGVASPAMSQPSSTAPRTSPLRSSWAGAASAWPANCSTCLPRPGGKVIWAGLRGCGCGAGTARRQREAVTVLP